MGISFENEGQYTARTARELLEGQQKSTVVGALASFARMINVLHGLPVSQAGLRTATDQGFQALPANANLTKSPIYLSFQFPPVFEMFESQDLKMRLVGRIAREMDKFEKTLRKTAKMTQEPSPVSHFEVKCEDDRIYITAQPILETPELIGKFSDIAAKIDERRGFMAGALGLTATALLGDGVRRVRNPENSSAHKLMGGGEATVGGLTGLRAAGMGIRALSKSIQESNPLFNPQSSEQQWENFMIALRSQLGVPKEKPGRTL